MNDALTKEINAWVLRVADSSKIRIYKRMTFEGLDELSITLTRGDCHVSGVITMDVLKQCKQGWRWYVAQRCKNYRRLLLIELDKRGQL